MANISNLESSVTVYSRDFPDCFESADNSFLFSKDGEKYLDFFSGAGALNYGHNNSYIKNIMMEYLSSNGIMHALDMKTVARNEFMAKIDEVILKPRQMDYKIMFCGATGTNAVEAALKLARKVTGRSTIFAFSGSFHGVTLGSLAVTSSIKKRAGAGTPLANTIFFPYPDDKSDIDTIKLIKSVLNDDHSGIECPAAIIIENIQAEGGVNSIDKRTFNELVQICNDFGILLICDEIQIGCGRTGEFFSFDSYGNYPDIVVLSKSISGIGLPMALLLYKSELDIWEVGEHNGTFRGNQLGFVCGSAALDFYSKFNLLPRVVEKEKKLIAFVEENIISKHPLLELRGRGLIFGIDFSNIQLPDDSELSLAEMVRNECFRNKLILECCGRKNQVLKILPPLTIEEDELNSGLQIICKSIQKCLEVQYV